MNKRLCERAAIGVMALGLAVPCASADLIPIVNPGFEEISRPLEPGQQTNGAGGSAVGVGVRGYMSGPVDLSNPVHVAGWRTRLPPIDNPTAMVYAGVLNPPVSGSTSFLTGQSGTYVGSVQVAAMQQTLNATVQPNTHYRLSFLAGFGKWATVTGVYASLLASPDLETLVFRGTPGTTLLSPALGIFPGSDTAGLMLPYSIEYTSPEVLPPDLVGKYLAISIVGSDGIPRMCYDDFRLEATRVPAPGVIGLAICCSLARKRRR